MSDKEQQEMDKNILLRRYGDTAYMNSKLGQNDPSIDNLPEIIWKFRSAVINKDSRFIDWSKWLLKISRHGTFNDWHEDPLN